MVFPGRVLSLHAGIFAAVGLLLSVSPRPAFARGCPDALADTTYYQYAGPRGDFTARSVFKVTRVVGPGLPEEYSGPESLEIIPANLHPRQLTGIYPKWGSGRRRTGRTGRYAERSPSSGAS
jgi:hypothetical protein